MTNQEINEAVARKLGWVYLEDGCEILSLGHLHRPSGVCWFAMSPRYCEDIAAAWEIMEREDFMIVAMSDSKEYRAGKFIGNYGPAGEEPTYVYGHWSVVAVAETAPMAICLAFLNLEDK